MTSVLSTMTHFDFSSVWVSGVGTKVTGGMSTDAGGMVFVTDGIDFCSVCSCALGSADLCACSGYRVVVLAAATVTYFTACASCCGRI